jgi:EAL domain-containing protein (putative c-di-GMP-specific phosphodiesterase class I)
VLGPIPNDAEVDDIAFRREPIVCLQDGIVAGEEWLLDHPLPNGRHSAWMMVLMALAEKVPMASLPQGNRWVAVNANSEHLVNRHFQPIWRSLARRCTENGIGLIIEWTENPPVSTECFQFLSSLRLDYDVQISIDDVGSSGADGLWRMTQSAPDWIKIDGAFFQRALHDAWARDAIAEIVRLARLRGARCIAEWIETPEQLAFAKGLGCEYGQGFLWRDQPPSQAIAP